MFMWQYKIYIFFFFFFTFMSGKRNEKQVGTEGRGSDPLAKITFAYLLLKKKHGQLYLEST